MLERVWMYDTEGKTTSVQYPNGGPTFTYTFDGMGRPVKLTDNAGTPPRRDGTTCGSS